jgi:predicted transcriptional regulator
MSKQYTLGELQLAIMRVIWQRGEATVADVQEALRAERGLALTTIATMLKRLEARGVVGHRLEGRQFVYRARVSEDQVKSSMVGQLTSRLFRGDPLALLSHLITEYEIDPDELPRLARLIAESDESDKTDGG